MEPLSRGDPGPATTVSFLKKSERLAQEAVVKGTMIQAHLAWIEGRFADARERLLARLSSDSAQYVRRAILATDWIPLCTLVEVDKAIAEIAGGAPQAVFRELGRHSATTNLSGAYKTFAPEDPHRFFEQMTLLHRRFQNFGTSTYEPQGERAGRIRIEGSDSYSPVFCGSSVGYYEGVLAVMNLPPVRCVETRCQAAGSECCEFDIAW